MAYNILGIYNAIYISMNLRNRNEINTIIYWAHTGGLANRLRALIGYQAMATFLDAPFFLCWQANDDCDAKFEHLFDPSGLTLITDHQLKKLSTRPGARLFDSLTYYSDIWHAHLAEDCPWDRFRDQAISLLRQLQPVESLLTVITEFAARNTLDTRYGLHIRMTDNLESYTWWANNSDRFMIEKVSRLSGFEAFICHAMDQDPAASFFLATDNPQAQEQLLRRAGGNGIIYPKKYRPPEKRNFSFRKLTWETRSQRTTPIGQALIDLLLLSRCHTIVGSYYSSFSEVAAIWGGKPHFVVWGDQVVPTPGMAELMGATLSVNE
jgi:hypothetical protein